MSFRRDRALGIDNGFCVAQEAYSLREPNEYFLNLGTKPRLTATESSRIIKE